MPNRRAIVRRSLPLLFLFAVTASDASAQARAGTQGSVVIGGGLYHDFSGAFATVAAGLDMFSNDGLGLTLEAALLNGEAATLSGDVIWRPARDSSKAATFVAAGYTALVIHTDVGPVNTLRLRTGVDVFGRSRIGFRLEIFELFLLEPRSTIGPTVRLGVVFHN